MIRFHLFLNLLSITHIILHCLLLLYYSLFYKETARLPDFLSKQPLSMVSVLSAISTYTIYQNVGDTLNTISINMNKISIYFKKDKLSTYDSSTNILPTQQINTIVLVRCPIIHQNCLFNE